MVTLTDKKPKRRDRLVTDVVESGVSVSAVTSPVATARGAKRAEYRVLVVPHVSRNGSLAKVADLLLERFAHALEQPFIGDFIEACSTSLDEEPLRQYMLDLNRLLQWDSANRTASKDPAQLPAGVVRFQALGIWNAQAWFDERGHIGRFPRLLVLIKILAGSAADDDELAAMLARAMGEGAQTAEAGKVVTRLRRELREDRVNRYGSGLDAISKPLLAAFNNLPLRETLPKLDFSDLVEINLGPATGGRRTLDEFEAWLRTGLSTPQHGWNLRRKMSTPGGAMDERTIARFAKALVASFSDGTHSHTILQWPSGPQPAIGISIASACVDEVLRSAPDWRVIWLCAARPTQPFFSVSVREFLQPLAKAFSVGLPPDGTHGSAEELGAVLNVLRTGLSRYKCLVVVEGLRNAGGRVGPLLDFLSGASTFDEVVRGLATAPVLEACAGPHTGFAASRFLLLPAQVMRGIVDLSGAKHGPPDLRTATAELLLAIKSVPAEANESALFALKKLHSEEDPPTDLANPEPGLEVHALVERLALAHPASLIVLVLIGSIPDGTLLGTLRRVFLQWRKLIEKVLPNALLIRASAKVLDDVSDRIRELATCVASVRDGEREPNEWLHGSRLHGSMDKLLYVELQEVQEHLGARQLQWEVEREIDYWKENAGPQDDDVTWGRFKPLLAFRSPNVRDLLIEAFCRRPSGANEGLNGFLLSQIGWHLMQFAAAGECLRQGTALLRNARQSGVSELESRRRLIQALHHILAAGGLTEVSLGDAGSEEIDHQELLYPADDYRRRSFVYSALYRQLIEHEEWWLTRAWGRSEMRVALLLQALYPGRHPRGNPTIRPRTAMEYDAQDGSDGSSVALDRLVKAAKFKQSNSAEHVKAHELRLQRAFFRSLLHAATDAEDHELAKRCLLLVKSLSTEAAEKPSVSTRRHQGVNGRGGATSAGTSKLEFDALDARSDDLAANAEEICRKALAGAGIEARWLYEVKTVGKKLSTVMPSGHDPAGLLKELRNGWLHIPTLSEGGDLGFVADMVARWADVLSNQADQIQDNRLEVAAKHPTGLPAGESQLGKEIEQFFFAWTAFWLANALRAEVGMQVAGHGQRWGKVSARAYRTGIRTTLKLARLLALKQVGSARASPLVRREPIPAVRWLLEYARSRADILARDVHLYERERIQSVLIQASIARTTANIDRDLNGPLVGHPSTIGALRDAVQYVSVAERRLIDLGSPRPVARRWIVERLNVLGLWLQQTVGTWSSEGKATTGSSPEEVSARSRRIAVLAQEIRHLAVALVQDLNALQQLADNSPFWVSLHRRATLRYELLRKRATVDGFNWPMPSDH